MTTYTKACPNCNTTLEYTNKRSWYNAKKRDSKCKSCQSKKMSLLTQEWKSKGISWGGVRNKEKEKNLERPFKRKCPSCNQEISYSAKRYLNKAEKYNTICNSCSTKKNKKGFLKGLSNQQIKQMRATKAGFSSWEEYQEKYPKKEMYKREVWKYTYRNNLESLPNWDLRGRNGVDGAYQLDHIVSINEGWEKNIPAEQIGRMKNLQMITWEKNRKKSDNSA
jgi:hypothetical protein